MDRRILLLSFLKTYHLSDLPPLICSGYTRIPVQFEVKTISKSKEDYYAKQ